MHSILVLNSKGGCGKTTIATNLAAYYSLRGKSVSLVDLDPQCSSLDWLYFRPENRPYIHGVQGCDRAAHIPRGAEVVIIDAPAGIHGRELPNLVKRAQTIVMPVLPSPFDLNASQRFTEELLDIRRVYQQQVRIGTVINRARENTQGSLKLEDYLRHLKLPNGRRLPFVGVLRASQNYIRAAEKGLSIFELAHSLAGHDQALWRPLTRWLNSKRSLPR